MRRISRLAGLLLLLLCATFLTTQFLVRPAVGIADNGDFPKITGPLAIGPEHGTELSHRFTHFVYKFIGDDNFLYDPGFLSSESPLAQFALELQDFFQPGPRFDIRWLGGVHGAFFLAAIGLWIFAPRPRWRILAGVAAVFVWTDVAYVQYLNSFYMDVPAIIFLVLSVAAGMHVAENPDSRVFAAVMAVGTVLFAASKAQHAVPALIFIPLFAVFAFWSRSHSTRSIWVAGCVALTLVAGVLVKRTTAEYQNQGVADLVFLRIAPEAPNPLRALQELGLGREELAFLHMSAFDPRGAIGTDERVRRFHTRCNYGSLLRYYVHHPSVPWRFLVDGLSQQASIMLPFGNRSPDDGFPLNAHATHFRYWSDFRSFVFRRAPWLIVLIALAMLASAGWLTFRSPPDRAFAALALTVQAMALTEYCLAVLGDAVETSRHLTIFNVAADISILLLPLLISRVYLSRTPQLAVPIAPEGESGTGTKAKYLTEPALKFFRQMRNAPDESPVQHNHRVAADLRPYLFPVVLALVTIAGLLIRLDVGRKTYINSDEWQHIFMASTPRLADLFFEIRTNSHPALFFLLLRGLVKLGSITIARSISIAAGAASIAVVGLIARRVIRSQAIQLLCAAAFAFSAAAISISVEVRSYQLAVFLTLLAFLWWLAMFRDVDGQIKIGPCIAFSVCSSLAMLSHYSVVFFLGACVCVPLILATISRPFREHLISRSGRKSVWAFAVALLVPLVVFGLEYVIHIRHQLLQGYNPDFYLGGIAHERVGGFVSRNSRNFFNLFSPVELHNQAAFLAVLALIGWAAWRTLHQRAGARSREVQLSVAPVAFAGVIILELLAASLTQKYPFGGALRHQYIAGPFLLIGAFVLVDAVVSHFRPILRTAVPALLLAASIANLAGQWPRLIVYPGVVILKEEFDGYRAAFPDARAVYLDHWAVIAHFIHTNSYPRRFVRRINDVARIDEYQMADGTQGGAELFYDKTRDGLDFSDPLVYQSFAACIRGSGIKELSLFFFSAGEVPLDRAPADMEKLIVQKAAQQGLTTTKIVVGRTTVFAGFKLTEK